MLQLRLSGAECSNEERYAETDFASPLSTNASLPATSPLPTTSSLPVASRLAFGDVMSAEPDASQPNLSSNTNSSSSSNSSSNSNAGSLLLACPATRSMLDRFVDRLPARLERIGASIQQEDLPMLEALVHGLKADAISLGCPWISRGATQLAQHIKAIHVNGTTPDWSELNALACDLRFSCGSGVPCPQPMKWDALQPSA